MEYTVCISEPREIVKYIRKGTSTPTDFANEIISFLDDESYDSFDLMELIGSLKAEEISELYWAGIQAGDHTADYIMAVENILIHRVVAGKKFPLSEFYALSWIFLKMSIGTTVVEDSLQYSFTMIVDYNLKHDPHIKKELEEGFHSVFKKYAWDLIRHRDLNHDRSNPLLNMVLGDK